MYVPSLHVMIIESILRYKLVELYYSHPRKSVRDQDSMAKIDSMLFW